MSESAYSLEAWRRLKERQQNSRDPESGEPDSVASPGQPQPSGIFDGPRYTPEEWIWNHIVQVPLEPDERCPVHWADCGNTRVWIVNDGSRWLMYSGAHRSENRRKDFASPFLNHAMQTAEYWYDPPRDGWHAEKHGTKSSSDPARIPKPSLAVQA